MIVTAHWPSPAFASFNSGIATSIAISQECCESIDLALREPPHPAAFGGHPPPAGEG